MRIAYITAGAAGTVCANCLKDNALAAALQRQGHEVLLLPAYTPLLTDEQDVSEARVVFGGVNLHLQGKYAFFRKHRALDRLLDHPAFLRWTSGFSIDTDPAYLGAMTLNMSRGEAGPHRREMAKLVAVLRDFDPQVVHLTNSLLACMAGPVRRELGVPVVCSLQGEAEFLAGLPSPYREDCIELLRSHAAQIEAFVACCRDQVEAMAEPLGGRARRIETVRPGITLDGARGPRRERRAAFAVGFLARIVEEKGLELLAEAVDRLRREHPERRIELRVAGWRGARGRAHLGALRKRHEFEDLGYLPRAGKFDFLAGLDAFSVPTAYRAAKGLYVLEALAAGVPVVQPRIGVFPEWIEATGGGLTCEPGDSADLAAKLAELLVDSARAERLGLQAQKVVRAEFHADRMASETVAVYESLGDRARQPLRTTRPGR